MASPLRSRFKHRPIVLLGDHTLRKLMLQLAGQIKAE
jgi:hypothetical protein